MGSRDPCKAIVSSDSDDSRRVSGSLLKDALEKSLSMHGHESAQAVFEYLKRSGMTFNGTNKYSVDQLNEHFNTLFGKDVAELITSQLRKALETS